MKPMNLHTTTGGLTEEQLDREAYVEQYGEARANGINIGTFKQWKEHRDCINEFLATRGR